MCHLSCSNLNIILGGSETSYSRHLVLLGEKLGVRWVRMLELSSKDSWDT